MALKYHDSPFHATEDEATASKSVLKADMTILIRDIIQEQDLTQAQAAERLGVSQPRVSNLINGKIDKFTLDNLFTMLDRLGFRAVFSSEGLDKSSICIERVAA